MPLPHVESGEGGEGEQHDLMENGLLNLSCVCVTYVHGEYAACVKLY